MRMNLHNHSTFSDGSFTPEEIVKQAIKSNFKCIGFSDHFSTLKLRSSRSSIKCENINEYIKTIRSVADRYQEHIKVYTGLEIDFSIVRTDLSSLSLLSENNPLNSLDYVLFEYVNDPDMLGLSLIDLINIRPFIKTSVGLAHNFISKNFGLSYTPEDLIDALERSNIFVELCPSRRNALDYTQSFDDGVFLPDENDPFVPYYRVDDKYTGVFFNKLRNSMVKVSIGTDTHNDMEELCEIDDAILFLEEKDLMANLITDELERRRNRV